MIEEFDKKKYNKYLFIAVIALSLVVIGVTYAAATIILKSETNTVSTGTVSAQMLESSDSINITNAFPMSDSQGVNLTHQDGSSGVFDFEVTTHASGTPGNIAYDLSIIKDSVDSGYTAFADNQIKVYLVSYTGSGALANETQVVAPTLVSNIITSGNTGYIKQNIVNSHSTANRTVTTKYRLKMWVNSSVDASSWTSSTKLQYKLRIKANVRASV